MKTRTARCSIPVCSALGLLLAIASSLAPAEDRAQPPPLEAGAAAVDITPQEWPVIPRGNIGPAPSTSAHDPLQAKALAFRSGEQGIVLCVVDVVHIGEPTNGEIRAEAAEAIGWPVENILLAGTHTHSAPAIHGTSEAAPEMAHRKRARAGIVAAIAGAVDNLEPASVAFGSEEVRGVAHNRRWYLQEGKMRPNPFGQIDAVQMNPPSQHITEPAGPTDPELSVISVRTAKGQPLAVLGNFSMHHASYTDGQISADYFGEFGRVVAYRVGGARPPEHFVGILSNGTSGDINNRDFSGERPGRAPFEQIRWVATQLADGAHRALADAEYRDRVPLGMIQRTVALRYRKPTEEMIAHAEKVLAMSSDEIAKAGMHRFARSYAARVFTYADYPETLEVTVQAIRIGEQAIVSLPFEVLVEIGLEIKEKSPFPRTFTIELANGGYGYLPTPRQHELGGYETWLGTNRVEVGSSEILVDELLEMLGELRE